ncbi:MAG: DMT family transporter [Rhodobacteraceae bacterium]|nr:DMT family transporter [Paracoccaceae bacterium]
MKAFSRLRPSVRGILFALAAFSLFTVMDAIAKGLSYRFDTLQVVWARYTAQTLVAVVFLAPRLRSVLKTRYFRLQLVRSAFLYGATMSFFFGIVLFGLAETSAVMSVNPLIITVAAYFVLGEQLGIRRIAAVSVGLVGALIIIRPGSDVFSPVALLPLLAATCYAGYAISTRFLGREESVWTSFLYTALIGTAVASLIVPWYWTWPTPADWGIMLAMGIIGSAGQLALIRALMLAEAGAVAPFAYVGPMLAAFWAWLFFDQLPDRWAVIGALVIIGAGIYVWHREYRQARRSG